MGNENIEAVAMKVLDDYIEALNRRDEAGMNEAFNFPHVRFASGTVTVFEKRGDYPFEHFDRRTRADRWHHTNWDYKRVVHASEEKVHLDVQFSRYREDGTLIGSYQALWVVTNQDGHWGVQARSSFAA